MARSRDRLRPLVAVGLFAFFSVVYWVSIPHAFNTVRSNERLFGSDGEFITRQFDRGEIFTHNDHLLYHVTATVLHRAAPWIPGLEQDAVSVHKLLSVVFGAAGVALLFVFGDRFSGRRRAALILSVLAGGTAGYWFFSATIDTYVPSLCLSILALGMALECARDHRMSRYVAMGAAMGAAFLLRTDGFLLAPLALVAVLAPRGRAARGAAALATALGVGGIGYAVLAYGFYDVPPAETASFALGFQERSRVEKGKWARAGNLRPRRLGDVAASHLVYSVILPDLRRPFDRKVIQRMGRRAYGPLSLGVLVGFGGWLVWGLARQVAEARRAGNREILVLTGIACLWLLTRILFYTWWDPFDAFLFAVMDLPALWLLCLLFVSGTPERPAPGARVAGVALLTAVVYLHNVFTLVLPIQDRTVEKHRSTPASKSRELRR